MLWPVAKMGDMIMGVDLHTVLVPPSPVPVPMMPHSYFGSIFLWLTPAFPNVNTLINGTPVVTSGAMGYGAHLPVFGPVPPTMMNLGYWKRYLLNIPMSLMLVALTMMANLAIAGISAVALPPDSSASKFMKDVTGIDSSSWAGAWGSIKGSITAYTQWSTWIKLLMPPVPYPAGQGSAAIGSPNVMVNGAPMAFCAPLMATSCSELPIVPNANVIGFSNIMVGVSFSAMARGIAVGASQAAVSTAVSTGVAKMGRRNSEEDDAEEQRRDGNEDCGCS